MVVGVQGPALSWDQPPTLLAESYVRASYDSLMVHTYSWRLDYGEPPHKPLLSCGGFALYDNSMEVEPDTTNVVYLDEYPHLAERVRLKRLGQKVNHLCQVFVLPSIEASLLPAQTLDNPPTSC